MNNEVIKTKTWRQAFKAFWQGWQNKKDDYENILIWWDVGKSKIRDLTQEIVATIAKEKREYEKCLTENINSIHATNPNDSRLDALKSEQKKFYENKASGVKIRSRANWE